MNQLFKVAGSGFGNRRFDLLFEQLFIGRSFDIAENANRHRIIRVFHATKHIGKVGIGGLLVMGNQIRGAHAVAKFNDGVLELDLPKTNAANNRKVVVQ